MLSGMSRRRRGLDVAFAHVMWDKYMKCMAGDHVCPICYEDMKNALSVLYVFWDPDPLYSHVYSHTPEEVESYMMEEYMSKE